LSLFFSSKVASQFNCLEFVGPRVTPEDGITGYTSDHTQGPACSVACGPATCVRNYFVDMPGGQKGQSAANQINNLADVSAAIGNEPNGRYFEVTNGYTMASANSLEEMMRAGSPMAAASAAAAGGDEAAREAILELLRVGVHSDTVVTSSNWGRKPSAFPDSGPEAQLVTQVFGSAISVSYSGISAQAWAPLATLILDASYEATLLAGLEARARHKGGGASNVVYLTLLGGGVFGNPIKWIADAIYRACTRLAGSGLDVRIVVYSGYPEPEISSAVKRFAREQSERQAAAVAPAPPSPGPAAAGPFRHAITQATYDKAVDEIVDEGSASAAEARRDAVAMFEAQGVDLSGVDVTGGAGASAGAVAEGTSS